MAFSAGLVSQHNQFQSPSTTNQSYSMNGKIIISALVILFFIVFIIILLHLYAKWLRRSFSIRSRLHHSLSFQDAPLTGGLNKEIAEALPVFAYKSLSLSKAVEAVECVVCLSNFRQDENCKLLPKCKHFFHIDCIDMWFLSNTTCPLCRTAADPSHCGEGRDVVGSMSCCLRNQDGVNELLGEQYQRTVVPTLATRDDLACDNGNNDQEKQGDKSRDTLLRGHYSLQSLPTSQSCRRSMSEKFSHGTQDAPLPTDGLFWANHTQTALSMNPTHWQAGGRSFSHISVDVLRPQESLVTVSSCPALRSLPSTLPHLVHRSVSELKSLKRLPSNK